jgi:hypothetical protein
MKCSIIRLPITRKLKRYGTLKYHKLFRHTLLETRVDEVSAVRLVNYYARYTMPLLEP